MIDNQNFQMSLYCAGSSYEDGIIEEVLFYEEKGYQYLTANFTPDGYDCVREEFLGVYGTEDHPAGWREELWKVPQNLVAITAAAYRRTSNYSPAKKPVL